MIKAFRHDDDIDELVANSYVIGKSGSSCIVIDMGDDGTGEIDYIKANYKKVAAVLLTHAHFDHFRGVGHFLQAFSDQSIKVYLEEEDYPVLMDNSLSLADSGFEPSFDPVLVKDGQILTIGDEKIQVIHTPFHTPGSCCYLFSEDNAIFTGDTLFKNSIGRTDLPKGDKNAVVPSLLKLKRLSDLLVCYPGHGEITKLGARKRTIPSCGSHIERNFNMENEENQPAVKTEETKEAQKNKKASLKAWFIDFFKGVGIGLSCNVPGASGGTTAVLENIFDKLISAVSNLFHKFKESFLILLPIMLGVILGFVATLKPMKLAMDNIPFGISCIFVGLIIGLSPSLIQKVKRKPNTAGLISFFVSLAVMIGINFIPGIGNFDLSKITFLNMFLTLIMGIIGAFALVVPGVSGALLLFIFGFYNPILEKLNDLVGTHAAVGLDFAFLVVFGIGVLIGFFASSKAMKVLINKHEYETYMGIMGFIVGSIYSIFHPFIMNTDAMGRFNNGLYPACLSLSGHIWLGVGLLVLVIGAVLTLSFIYLKKNAPKEEKKPEENAAR